MLNEALPYFTEEALQTQNMRSPLPTVDAVIANLEALFPGSTVDGNLLQEAADKMVISADGRDAAHAEMVYLSPDSRRSRF